MLKNNSASIVENKNGPIVIAVYSKARLFRGYKRADQPPQNLTMRPQHIG